MKLNLEPLNMTQALLVFKVKNTEDELIRLGFLGTEAYIQLFRVHQTISVRVLDTSNQIMWAARVGSDLTTTNTYLLKVILDNVKNTGKPNTLVVMAFRGNIF